MKFTYSQVHSFVERFLYKFLIDGSLKAYGVIFEETVTSYRSHYYFIGCVFTIQNAVAYLMAPFAGFFNRRFSARTTTCIGGFLASIGFFGHVLVNVNSAWQLFVFLSVSGLGFGLVNIATVINLKKSFGENYPTAYSGTMLSSYLGIMALPALMEYLQREYSTKFGMAVFGVMTCSLVICGLVTPSKEQNKDGAGQNAPNTDSKKNPSKELMQAVNHEEKIKLLYPLESRKNKDEASEAMIKTDSTFKVWKSMVKEHPEFLFLLYTSILTDYGFASWSIFLIPYGENLGLDSQTAVWLSTFGGIAGVTGRLLCIILFYRGRMTILVGLILPALAVTSGYIISLAYSSFPFLALVAFLSGFGLSVQACVISSWVPRCVDDSNFEDAVDVFYLLCGFWILLGGFTTGAIIDVTNSYPGAFVLLACLSLTQAAMSTIWCFSPFSLSKETQAEEN